MSSSVHISAITLLAPLPKERPALRIWPFTGMIVLLVVEMASHGFRKQPLGRSCYLLPGIGVSQKGQTTVKIVRRRMTTRWRAGVNADAVLSYIILVSNYCWKVGGMFDSACAAYNQWTRYFTEWIFENLMAYTARKACLAYKQNSMNRLGWLIA
jgi:hypothetical protein